MATWLAAVGAAAAAATLAPHRFAAAMKRADEQAKLRSSPRLSAPVLCCFCLHLLVASHRRYRSASIPLQQGCMKERSPPPSTRLRGCVDDRRRYFSFLCRCSCRGRAAVGVTDILREEEEKEQQSSRRSSKRKTFVPRKATIQAAVRLSVVVGWCRPSVVVIRACIPANDERAAQAAAPAGATLPLMTRSCCCRRRSACSDLNRCDHCYCKISAAPARLHGLRLRYVLTSAPSSPVRRAKRQSTSARSGTQLPQSPCSAKSRGNLRSTSRTVRWHRDRVAGS